LAGVVYNVRELDEGEDDGLCFYSYLGNFSTESELKNSYKKYRLGSQSCIYYYRQKQ
jgi:hypothetical protein